MTLGEILEVSVAVFRDSFGKLVVISLALQVPYMLLAYAYGLYAYDPNGDPEALGPALGVIGIGLLGTLVVQPLTNAASTKLIVDRYRDRPTSIGRSFQVALRLLPGLLGAVLLGGLFTTIGLILLVIPGIYLAVRFALVAPVVVVERRGGPTALNRSGKLVHGSGWKIFGLFLLMFAFGLVGAMFVEAIGGDSWTAWLVQAAFEILIGAFFAAVWTITYFSCRCEREGFDLEVLAASVD